jgi:hypothetical protein
MEIMARVDRGEIALIQAAGLMGLSYRQAKRVRARYAESGAAGLVHRGRGREGNRGADPNLRQRCLDLVAEHYEDFGPTLAAEKLAEEHQIAVDHETLRRWRIAAGLWQTRPGRKHRRRRRRRERFGELIQIDGSHHAWFEDRADPCCLMVMIDDATGLRRARMASAETVRAAMELTGEWIGEFGIPQALYADRKNTFTASADDDDRDANGAFVRACAALDVPIIAAGSPQAKGRVERSNRVFQDRLIKDLRLAGIDTIEAANRFLASWIQGHSERFQVRAPDPLSAHRCPGDLDLGAILAWHYRRRLNRDFTVRLHNRWYQVLPRDPMPQPGRDVTLRRRLDGTLEIMDSHGPLPFEPLEAPPPPAPPRSRVACPRKPCKPAPDHPWRRWKP